jgi:hypothetical protein
MVKRNKFFDNPVEELSSVNENGPNAAPPAVVRAMATAILHVYARDPMSLKGVKFGQIEDLALRVAQGFRLTLKKNVLEPGEQEVNSTLRLRSFRQARISGVAARRADERLYQLLARANNFERNGVGVTLTEHERWVLEESRRVLQSIRCDLDTAAQGHINFLRSAQ